MTILYSGYRDNRHSQFGGYDYIAQKPLSDYLNAAYLPFGKIPVGKPGKRLNLYVLDFTTRLYKNKYDIIHLFYGDFMLFHNIPKRRKAQFITTIHMRAEDLSLKTLSILKSYDAVVVLSSAQERFLRDNGINAYFIPHGFNVPVFKKKDYAEIDCTKINVFYSGNNYRDFTTFVTVIQSMEHERSDVHFYAVGQTFERKEILLKHHNVTVCSYLDDDAYYSLLSDCDYNFLPLTFATANNTLLEAQNIGVVSVLPEIDGISDYADSENNLYYENVNDAVELFKDIAKPSIVKNEWLIHFAEKFAWKNVYGQLEGLYTELLK